MRSFSDFDPIALTVYFFAAAGSAMFCMEPVNAVISLLGAVTLYVVRSRGGKLRTHLWSAGLFVVMALVNPVITHNGKTVLFVFNDDPITLESLIFGLTSATVITAVLYWFMTFSQIMTSDRLLYVFGALSPKLALVLSMTLRYVRLFRRRWRQTQQTQRALGLYKDDNIIDSIRGGLRVFSIMMTWSLESGITTADSMAARGYGVCRRTSFRRYRIRRADAALIAVSLALLAVICTGIALGALHTDFYPEFTLHSSGTLTVLCHISCFVLAFLPSAFEAAEAIKWKYLQSRS
jgi:energy-coupling factor transport system permease protein